MYAQLDRVLVEGFDTYPVRNVDTGLNYATIQNAIDASETLDGHTIFVEKGTYHEHVVVNKSLSLIGENRENTIIDGNYSGTVVTITANNVTISSFTITNSGQGYVDSGMTLDYARNCNISDNVVVSNRRGILMESSDNNELSRNNIEFNNFEGVELRGCANTKIHANIIAENHEGVRLGVFFFNRGYESSSNNSIVGNTILNNEDGIYLYRSSSNVVSHNNITNNYYGIRFYASSYEMLRSNSLSNNTFNLQVSGWSLLDFVNNVDTSNVVDDRPVYYWVNKQDMVVPLDAGYVTLINCTRITAQNLTLKNNGEGVLLVSTTDSTLTENSITKNGYGIKLRDSANNAVSGNNITNNSAGIYFSSSSNCTISGNNITDNDDYGIYLSGSSDNTVFGNNIIDNDDYGIYLTRESRVSSEEYWFEDYWYKESQRNNIVKNNIVGSNHTGIAIHNCGDNVCYNNSISRSGECGICLISSDNNTLLQNAFSNNKYGVYLRSCSSHKLSTNTVFSNKDGICIDNSFDTVLSDNIIFSNSERGVYISLSVANVVMDNNVSKNLQGILLFATDSNSLCNNTILSNQMEGIHLNSSSNNLLSDNTVTDNGKGIYAIQSTHNFITGNNVSYNWYGIELNRSFANVVTSNGVSYNWCGITFAVSGNNFVTGNNVSDNLYGIELVKSHFNSVLDNTVAHNGDEPYGYGVYLDESFNNVLSGNTIANNLADGIHVGSDSKGNKLFRNNVKDNPITDEGISTWDNGAEGNYWSDYEQTYPDAIEIDNSGIWDTPYVVNQKNNVQDNHPLKEPVNPTKIFAITWEKETYDICITTNCTVANVTFNQLDRQISFKATGPSGTIGVCNVTIPRKLLDSEPDQWTIEVNGKTARPSVDNHTIHTHTIIHFTFTHNLTQKINIRGTDPIDNMDPHACARAPPAWDEDEELHIDARASTDNIELVDYTWTYTDIDRYELSDETKTYQPILGKTQTLHGVDVLPTFSMPGTYVITLNVTDRRGHWDSVNVTIVIRDTTSPVAHAGSDPPAHLPVKEGTLVTFDGSNSTDNVGPTYYTWSCMSQMHQTVEMSGQISTYNFTTPGIYNVTLIVTDAAGNVGTDKLEITVLDVTPPRADLGSNLTVYVNENVVFDASASSDNVNITTYRWTIDGRNQTTKSPLLLPISFPTPGTYTVTLTVTDTSGHSSTTEVTVTVSAIPLTSQLWFWVIVITVSTTFGLSFLFFWQRRTEGVLEKLERLARKHMQSRDEEKREKVLKELERLKEKVDAPTRKFIDESWDSILRQKKGEKAIEEWKKKRASKQ